MGDEPMKTAAAKEEDFRYVREMFRARAGIVLDASKDYLVDSRLSILAREEGFPSVTALVTAMRADPGGPLPQRTVEALVTNETMFFRDRRPFEGFARVVMPAVVRRTHDRVLRVWSCACSTGQEPYSLVMAALESGALPSDWRMELLATDVSAKALDQARAGIYRAQEVARGLSAERLSRFFDPLPDGGWRVKEEVRRLVDFRSVNLVHAWPPLPPMDVVFLRNVLIYFGQDMKKSILDGVKAVMRPDAYLFLGAAETALTMDSALKRHKAGDADCYRLVEPGSV